MDAEGDVREVGDADVGDDGDACFLPTRGTVNKRKQGKTRDVVALKSQSG